MKKEKETVQRFRGSEILLHWSNAVVYLVLFCTGATLLVERVTGHPFAFSGSFARIHRIAGVVLVALLAQMLLLSVIAENARCFWRTLAECLTWRKHDIVWLLKVPLNTLVKRVALPPADRFNAGQKLHLLAVLVALLGFSVSGLTMILLPGALGPWIVHVACFFLAAAFLLLHLFLSLVNPETRKSLPSIFSGKTTVEYARRHHGRWLGQADEDHRASYVSLRAILVILILVVGVAVALAVRHGTAGAVAAAEATIAQEGTNAIDPGPLSLVHVTDKAGAENCGQCHSAFASPRSEKCLVCHDEIKDRLTTQSGYHGTLSGPCRLCHREHQGRDVSLVALDAKTFNHNQANFHLQGKHQQVPCEACHSAETTAGVSTTLQYIGLEYGSCVSCHADPHPDERSRNCLQCHTMEGWDLATLVFDHARDSRFVLEGAHARLACEACHPRRVVGTEVELRLFGLGEACRDCHADPHGGQFEQSCDACHFEHGWKGVMRLSFHGPDSSFPLVGQHTHLRCDQCHKIPVGDVRLADAQFVGLNRECASCHADPHAGQMSHPCQTCHSEAGWGADHLKFSHERDASFKLDGLHATLACASCHGQREKRYRPLPTECAGCHQVQERALTGIAQTLQGDPDPHDGRLSCTDCHDVSKPAQNLSEFADRCASCHNAHYRELLYGWSQSFAESRAAALRTLDETQNLTEAQRHAIKSRSAEVSEIGFHNLSLAQRLWEQLAQAKEEYASSD